MPWSKQTGFVRYACRREYAATAVDILARRTRLAFLSVQAAEESLPRIMDIMSEELGWSRSKMKAEAASAHDFLRVQMGKGANKTQREQAAVNLSVDEIKAYTKIFNALDYDAKGYITINDIKKTLEVIFVLLTYLFFPWINFANLVQSKMFAGPRQARVWQAAPRHYH